MTSQEEIRAIIQGHATRGDIHNHDEGEEFGKVEITLRALQKYGNELLPTLIDSLSDPGVAVRQVAMRLLWEMDTDDESVLPAMIMALEDSNKSVRHGAAGFVTRFGERAKAAIPILQSWIDSGDELSHVMAAGSILVIDPTKTDELLSVLIDALESEDDGIKMEACWQLERLGGMANDSVPALSRLLDDHSTVSMPATDAIHRITGDPTDVINLGLNLLDHEEWLQRCVGAEHLRMLGAKALLAVPRLQWAALDDENNVVRNTAKAALEEIK
jgi:HEAT repeat protein